MDDQAKMQRLLQLLVLLSGKQTYSVRELSQRFEVTERTIYRYLETFDAAGFLVERTEGRYRLQSGNINYKALQQNLHFSEEELHLLHSAISSLVPANKAALHLRQKLQTLYHYQALAQTAAKRDTAKIQVISEAIDRKCCVLLNQYRSINSQTIQDRLVEPFAFHDDYEAVWCWERQSGSNKLFLVGRMDGVTLSRERWQYEKKHQVPFIDAFRISAPKPVADVEALLSLKAYSLLVEEYPLSEKYLQAENGSYRLCIPVAGYLGIGRFVLGLPGEVKVLGPEAFVNFLEEKKKKVWEGDGN
jgi:predicted DNA-binding transcriptional regulator YafY